MLNKYHWAALSIITIGCILKALDSMELSSAHNLSILAHGTNITSTTNNTNLEAAKVDAEAIKAHPAPTLFNYGLIGIHILISTIAGVFNEKLLKDKPSVCINLQNMCLYFNGILFLSLGMLIGLSDDDRPMSETLSPSSLKALFSDPAILSMAIVMSCAGIVTSRFLHIFDSIRKSVAVALVVVSLPLLSKLLFDTPITVKTIISILLVLLGMHIYTSQPPPARRIDVIEGGGAQQAAVKMDKNSDTENEDEDESELFLNGNALPGNRHNRHTIGDEQNGQTVFQQEMSTIRCPTSPNIV